MKAVIPTSARVGRILEEVREAFREDARKLVERFVEEEQVAVAEMLADADAEGKFGRTKIRIGDFVETGFTPASLFNLYRELELKPSGAERS